MRILINNNKKSKNSDYRNFTYLVESVWFCVHTNIYFFSNSCGWNSSSKLSWTWDIFMHMKKKISDLSVITNSNV